MFGKAALLVLFPTIALAVVRTPPLRMISSDEARDPRKSAFAAAVSASMIGLVAAAGAVIKVKGRLPGKAPLDQLLASPH
ncbi:hypothetical protein D3C85_278310 [compost metagenome]